MKQRNLSDKQFEHGQLVKTITVKAFYARKNESFLMDENDNRFQGLHLEKLEANKSFQLQNIIIERRNNFCFQYTIVPTKETQIIKLKRNIKVQFKKEFQKFKDAEEGKITNLKCIIVNKDGPTLKLFDGQFFRMKMKDPIEFENDKLEVLFVKKSSGYNYIWETELTTIIEGNNKDSSWDDIGVPEIKIHKNPNDMEFKEVGRWIAMLTAVTPPFTYSNFNFKA